MIPNKTMSDKHVKERFNDFFGKDVILQQHLIEQLEIANKESATKLKDDIDGVIEHFRIKLN